jgi:hypothetical protein
VLSIPSAQKAALHSPQVSNYGDLAGFLQPANPNGFSQIHPSFEAGFLRRKNAVIITRGELIVGRELHLL